MLDRPRRLLDGAAFDGEDDVARRLAADLDDPRPVDHAVAAGAADRRAGDLAALGGRLLDRDVLGVQVDEPVGDALQPGVGIVAAEVGVAGVEVDADGRALDQVVDAVQARRGACCIAGAARGRSGCRAARRPWPPP